MFNVKDGVKTPLTKEEVEKIEQLETDRKSDSVYGITYRYGLELFKQRELRRDAFDGHGRLDRLRVLIPDKKIRGKSFILLEQEFVSICDAIVLEYKYPEKPDTIDVSKLTRNDEQDIKKAIESEM